MGETKIFRICSAILQGNVIARRSIHVIAAEKGYLSHRGRRIPRRQAEKEVQKLLLIPEKATPLQEKNMENQRRDIMQRYLETPDLKSLPENGYRLYNAVSDFANHAKPLRETGSYRENLFARMVDGSPLLDTFLEAYESGAAFGIIVQRLLQICGEGASGEGMDMGFLRSFEKVGDRICYRLVGRDRNREMLEDMPHVGFLDMAACRRKGNLQVRFCQDTATGFQRG